MKHRFSARMGGVQKSFIREILKVAQDPQVISFAGGLPNPRFFPVQALKQASQIVLEQSGGDALQYAPTPGYPPLREYIANRYAHTAGIEVNPDDVLITNGSQQGLDLIGKILLDPGDPVVVESPSYLGGIQAFSLYQPEFVTVRLESDGPDMTALEHRCQGGARLFYCLPNFQNPSGISYSAAKRTETSRIINGSTTYLVEDDPYRELRFIGETKPMVSQGCREQAFLLGSFSKTVAPGLRMGWVVAPPPLMEKLLVAKQASDLHSNYLSQRIINQYLADNPVDDHIGVIRDAYHRQRETMVQALSASLPSEVHFTLPEGGMFLWITLPPHISAMALFEEAAAREVVFVPGSPFYVGDGEPNTLRLNFSNTDDDLIREGVVRLAEAYTVVAQS